MLSNKIKNINKEERSHQYAARILAKRCQNDFIMYSEETFLKKWTSI